MEILKIGRTANLSQAHEQIKCNFCPLTFEDSAKANAHLLEHFEQEFCHKCDQNLIRIGESLYVLHGTVTCIDKDIKREPFDYDESEREIPFVCLESVDGGKTLVEDIEYNFLNEDENKSEYIEPSVEPFINIELINEDKAVTSDHNAKRPIKKSRRLRKPAETRTSKSKKIDDDEMDEFEENRTKLNYVDGQSSQRPNYDTFSCEICDKTFSGKHTLRRHNLRVHLPLSKHYKCEICGKSFLYKNELVQHNKNNIICNTCGETFCAHSLLQKHQAKFCNSENIDNLKLRKCERDGCNEVVAANQWAYHMTTKHNDHYKRFECDICKKTCPNKGAIQKHILTKHCPSSRKFKCNLCRYSCVSEFLLKSHIKLVHTNESPQNDFMCSECGKVFKQKCLLRHHSFTHTGEKPYECFFSDCTKRFRRTSQRIEHMRMHTGEKPFVCPVEGCDRRYSYSIDMKRHKFSAHGIFTRKYPCQICSEVFPENQFLKKHMKKHENQI